MLPICLIEHTDTNIIISMTCPKTLENSLKNIIKNAFESIRPQTIKGFSEDKNLSDTNIETKDDKTYINSFNKFCSDEEEEIEKTCETNLNIITDKNGNFISSKRISKSESDSISNNYEYNFEDISKKNTNLDPGNYKLNLDDILESIKTLMENNVISEQTETETKNRNLNENEESKGSQEISPINVSYFDINVSYSYKIDSGYEGENSKLYASFNSGNESKEITHNEIESTFNQIINEFVALSKAGNSLGSTLYNQIIDLLIEIREKINQEFNNLDKNLTFKDLSAIFDSTFAVAGLSEFPYTIVSSSKNLYNKIKELNDDLLYSVDDYKKQLNSDISTFLSNSHTLLYNIFTYLKELSIALSSQKSKIASIASYYGVNDTNSSYVKIIEEAKEILNNYYINEKNLIEPKLNEILNNFELKSNQLILNGQYILDNITNRLENNSVVINRGDEDDIRSVIDNLYNSKILENKIIPSIVQIMKNKLLKNNGYFETQEDLEQSNKTYTKISEDAFETAKELENNEYIDSIFDDIMKYFRNQFYEIMKNIEKSKNEKFPFKENVLGSSISFYELDESFKNDKINISNQIKKENNNFINVTQNIINSFLESNKEQLINIVQNINNNLSKLNLSNLNDVYQQILTLTMNTITKVIEDNDKLALAYFADIKSTTHRTATIDNKITVYYNKLAEIKTYVEKNLKSDLVNKYKNIINQIRKNLQSIKSNSIIKMYSEQKDLSPIFKSHLNIIDPLFSRLDDYISDTFFNKNYLPIINKYITATINKINNIQKNYNNLYAPLLKISYSSDKSNDIYYLVITYTRYCAKRFFGCCIKRKTRTNYNYYPKKVTSTNYHLSLKKVDFEQYSKNLNDKFNEIQKVLSNNVVNYNNILSNLNNDLQKEINNYKIKKVNNLNLISEKAKSFLEQNLGVNLLTLSYNYFKNEINEKLPQELNSILEQWNSLYDKVYNDINTNIKNFKYPIEEFSTLATIYYSFYYYNISYSYSDFVIEQRKSDFNYTIKYYYNMFISKVNKTYAYILNNIPKNEKPFDTVLDNQINEIKSACNEIINKSLISQKEILNIKNQTKQFKISEDDFFVANLYANDMADEIESQLSPRIDNFDKIVQKTTNRYDSVESVSSRYYLENLLNGKQINDLYESINKGTFIDFQINSYNELFDEVLEIDEIDLKNKISDVLRKSNSELEKSFEYEKNKYKSKLQNPIFEKLYTKDGLENKINLIYNNGLKNLDNNSKDQIIKYINEITDLINTYLKNEQSRLNDEITHYSKNYKVIENRLNNYKNLIYNEFHSAILSVVNDFYSQIYEKFYTEYIEFYLDIYYNSTKKEKFSDYKFLNTSFNLKAIMDQDIEEITAEYKNWTLNQINFLKDQKIQQLDVLFSFSSIKNQINTKIDSYYKSTLLEALKKIAVYNSGDEGISDYDFSESILNNINSKITNNIKLTKNIIENKMKGTKYVIEDDWNNPSFSNAKKEVFNQINALFGEFTLKHGPKEIKDFNNSISENINNNFKLIIDGFIPSFGKDYFERVLKYNEIQKIKTLYGNLQYSIGVTLTYYIYLSISDAMSQMPEDLETKILSVNSIDTIVNSKNNEVLDSLNSKLNDFFENTKNDLINKYISHMINDKTIKDSFDTNILDLVNTILNEKKYIFENEYIKMMNTYIKNPFIEQYKTTLNKETMAMLDFIEENKEILRIQLKDLLSMNNDEVLNNIETKLNNTIKAIDDYKLHFKSFKISDVVKNFLNEYVENNILNNHKPIKKILDERTKDLILQYFNSSSEEFKKSYIYEEFESKLNETNDLLKNTFIDKIIEYIKAYGAVDTIYENNLKKEIINYTNTRRLESNDEIDSQKIADIQLDKTMKALKESSQSLKLFVENLDIFSNFKDKIDGYVNNINEQYLTSQNSIKEGAYTEEVSEQLNQNLEELKELSLNYYDKAKKNYEIVEKYIENSIKKINNLIESALEVTYDTINSKYKEIKDKFNPVNNKTEKIIDVDPISHEETDDVNNYKAEIKMNKYNVNNEFYFDIQIKDGEISTPKIIAKSIIRDRPDSLVIEYSSIISKCVNKGKEMTVNLNDISSSIELEFDTSTIETEITKKYNFDEYTIDNKYFDEKETPMIVKVGRIPTTKLVCKRHQRETPPGEKEKDIIEARNYNQKELYNF